MLVRDFDFGLPPELIAQEPAPERGAARLLCLDRGNGAVAHRLVADLPTLLRAGDVVVVNNTRVFPARLLGRRVPSGGTVECLLIGRDTTAPVGSSVDDTDGEWWEALMHPGQRLGPGARVVFDGAQPAGRGQSPLGSGMTLHGEIVERRYHGRRLIRLWTENGLSVDTAVDAIGHMPLPPYIKRADRNDDYDRYQTVFARARGSVAAPTAGLHLSTELVTALETRGIALVEITLHVGYGTFQPVRVDCVEDHRLESEQYEIGATTAARLNQALDEGRRIIAVGTTTTRTLEAVALTNGGRLAMATGTTDLFISPGFQFRVVGGLMTNFHLPRSSLLMLVSAFAGRERVLEAYETAVAMRYRFYSYGDAMLIL